MKPGLCASMGIVALALSACGDTKNAAKFRLEGSLGQVMDLAYDEVRLGIGAADVALTFVRIKPLEVLAPTDGGAQMAGVSEDYPLKIAYQLNGDPPPKKGKLDLAAMEGGAQRGVTSRNVQGDPRNTFPPIVRGELVLDRDFEVGMTVTGSFHVTFENGIEVASGRTVFTNSFSALVQ